jgi:hypothetical protein
LLTNSVRYAAVDGREVETPLWKAEGLPFAQLPLAGTAGEPNPKRFPFKRVAGDWVEFPSRQFSIPSDGKSAPM